MDGSHRRAGTLLGTVGAALREGKITFPERGLPAELAAHAGRRVETGPVAHAYAAFIKGNLAKATGGMAPHDPGPGPGAALVATADALTPRSSNHT
ncbi:hypothetical protein [Streptomyces sp. NPDC005760]